MNSPTLTLIGYSFGMKVEMNTGSLSVKKLNLFFSPEYIASAIYSFKCKGISYNNSSISAYENTFTNELYSNTLLILSLIDLGSFVSSQNSSIKVILSYKWLALVSRVPKSVESELTVKE